MHWLAGHAVAVNSHGDEAEGYAKEDPVSIVSRLGRHFGNVWGVAYQLMRPIARVT